MNLTEVNLLIVQSMAPPLSRGTFLRIHHRCFLIFKPKWKYLTLQILSPAMTVWLWGTNAVTSAVGEEGCGVHCARALALFMKELNECSAIHVLAEDGECVMYVMVMAVLNAGPVLEMLS